MCRGIAAILVLFFHTGIILGKVDNFGLPPFGNVSYFGRSGVDFFFVLSGFLISLLHWRDIGTPKALKTYTIRRLTRIYPTYWLVIAAIIPFDIFQHTLFDHYNDPIQVLNSVFLVPQPNTILNVTWSLEHELLFYALFGAAIFRRSFGIALGGIWLIVLVVAWGIGTPSSNMFLQTIIRPLNIEFFAGVATGWAFGKFRFTYPGPILMLGLICFGSLWACDDFLWPLQPDVHLVGIRSLGYATAAAAVILSLSSLELNKRFTMPKFFVSLGGASYLLYLIHVPALLIIGAAMRSIDRNRYGPDWFIALVADATIIATAIIIHLRIERPVLQAIRQRVRQPRMIDDGKPTG